MKNRRRPAFTLIELMISLALALMLILGINQVFALTSRTVGASQALISAYQGDRAAQRVINQDFKGMVNTAPLMITSQYLAAFRSSLDAQTDQDGSAATVDPIGATSYSVPANILHYRNHRVDTIAFCVRDIFQRQTGGTAGAYLTPGTSYEAYVWYGHVKQMTTGNGYQTPGGTGNAYASGWILGRMAMLFQQNPTGAHYSGLPYTTASVGMTGYQVQSSRFDVVGGTIDSFTAAITANSTYLANWYGSSTSNNLTLGSWLNYRFQCDPKPGRPLIPDSAAYYVPAFVSGCSQFCVEFAGDFVAQKVDGSIDTTQAAGPDGTIDFNIINGVRQIRWYGMPRSVTGDGTVNYARGDVVRVQDVPGIPTTAGQVYTFERTSPAGTYTAAWHPSETYNPRPKLIRITMALDDSNNRLGAPPVFEYVLSVP